LRKENPGGGEIFRTCPDRPCGTPSLLYNGYRIFPGGKVRLDRDAYPHLLLVPRSKIEYTLPKGFRGLRNGETYLISNCYRVAVKSAVSVVWYLLGYSRVRLLWFSYLVWFNVPSYSCFVYCYEEGCFLFPIPTGLLCSQLFVF
jgi:hypothetical protein